MSSLITLEHIRSHIPSTFSQEENNQATRLVNDIRVCIDQKLAVGIDYDRVRRLIIPCGLYLQYPTGRRTYQIRHPVRGYPQKMTVTQPGARRAVGMDAYELLRSPEDPKKESGWKTFHINKIEGLRLLTTQEIEKVFPILRDDPVLAAPSEIPEGFVRNWNYWFREFLGQHDDAKCDLLPKR